MKKLKAFVLLAVIALGITAISRERSNLLRAALTRIVVQTVPAADLAA